MEWRRTGLEFVSSRAPQTLTPNPEPRVPCPGLSGTWHLSFTSVAANTRAQDVATRGLRYRRQTQCLRHPPLTDIQSRTFFARKGWAAVCSDSSSSSLGCCSDFLNSNVLQVMASPRIQVGHPDTSFLFSSRYFQNSLGSWKGESLDSTLFLLKFFNCGHKFRPSQFFSLNVR